MRQPDKGISHSPPRRLIAMPLLDAPVLILNRNYQAVHLTHVRRALCLLAKGHVKVLGEDFQTYDWEEWLAVEPSEEEFVTTAKRRVAVPHVIMTMLYDRLPRRSVKFSRRNVYLRDGLQCQFCGRRLPLEKLNLDHVIPQAQGGKSTWDNTVTSCIECNTRKRDRTPEQAGMRLLRKPDQPRWQSFLSVTARKLKVPVRESWKTFLTPQVGGER